MAFLSGLHGIVWLGDTVPGAVPGIHSIHRPALEQMFSHLAPSKQNEPIGNTEQNWQRKETKCDIAQICLFVLNLCSRKIFPRLVIVMELSLSFPVTIFHSSCFYIVNNYCWDDLFPFYCKRRSASRHKPC